MNGGADLGGMMGFGPVVEEQDEPNFHEDWEARVLGITVALGACGQWNLDQSRHARETMPTAQYLNASYYEIWLHGITKLLHTHEMIDAQELSSGTARLPVKDNCNSLRPEDVDRVLMAGGPVNRPIKDEALFAVGQRVRTINEHPLAHTRLPRYARDKTGTVTFIHGFHVFPDSNAKGEGEQPTWLYKVSFDATTLWGESGSGGKVQAGDKVHLDLWQPYLVAL